VSDPVLSVERLAKHFRGRAAVVDATFAVPAGAIYALLGPNGAGKTTAMRCCLGLVRPTSGHARLFGADAWGADPAVRARVGALIASPGLVSGLSAGANLRRHARLLGAARPDAALQAQAALDAWGLSHLGATPARRLSRGEQQRTALAAAFLGDPELLVLDEPTEGLDPLAIADLRGRLIAAKERGATVVISSHLLSEVEQCATHCAVIAEGRVRVAGALAELGGGERRLRLEAAPLERALAIATEAGLTASMDGGGIVVAAPDLDAAALVRRLVEGGVEVSGVAPLGAGLEAIYRAAIGSSPAAAAGPAGGAA
jgi:ABC-2 type transport system ATP-binding protein